MDRENLDRWLERAIAGLTFAFLAFGPLATGAVRLVDFAVVLSLVGVATLLWLVRVWAGTNRHLLWPPPAWVILAFVAYGVYGYATADLEYVARRELTRVVAYGLCFLVVLNNVHRQKTIRWLILLLSLLAACISLYALYQFVSGSPYVWHFLRPATYAGRGSGTYICPNHLAGFLEMVIPMALSLALLGRVNALWRVLLLYGAAASLCGVAVTLSRAGWLATALSLAMVLVALLRERRRRFPVIVALVLLVVVAAAALSRSELAQSRLRSSTSLGAPHSPFIRIELAKSALQMWLDHVWFGVGPGHFDYRYPAYRTPRVYLRPGFAHNDYLNTLADWGLVGGVLVLTAVGLMGGATARSWRYVRPADRDLGSSGSNRAALVLGGAASWTAVLTHAFFDFSMQIPANAILAIAIMAWLTSCLRYTSDRYWRRARLVPKLGLSVLLLAAVGFLGTQGWRNFREGYWLDRARLERYQTETRRSALHRAAEIEPGNFETLFEIGESLRQVSWEGNTGYQAFAEQAIPWFQRAREINPYDGHICAHIGMCLDWLGRQDEATAHFDQALALDPNNYFLRALRGWHSIQQREVAQDPLERARLEQEALDWFFRSKHIKWWDNPALHYISIIERRRAEAAAQSKPR